MGERKLLYKRRMVKYLYFSRSLSCADLSVLMNKSLAHTTKYINELMKEGIVVETGFAPSSGGRRATMYSLKVDMMYIVAVAMDQLFTRIGIIDMQNKNVIVAENFNLDLKNNPNVYDLLSEYIDRVILNSGIQKEKIAGVGVGMPGFIDVKKGMNYSYQETFPAYAEVSIRDYVSQKINLPVFMDNDSSIIALAELRSLPRNEEADIMVVNVGWGIGLGLIINGNLFRGNNGFAGELSHIPLFNNNKLCSCGKYGCLETEASLLVVAEKAVKGLAEGRVSIMKDINPANPEAASNVIIQAAKRGDRFAIELISESAYHIGRALAILIHIINPQKIILSGRGAAAGRIWLAPIQQAINEHCIPRLAANTEIQMSELGYNAELEGAAALVMENFDSNFILKQKMNINILS